MSKWIAIGMAGFLLELKYRQCGKWLCCKKTRRKIMKLIGL